MWQRRRTGVYGICRDDTGRILLVRSSPTARVPRLWQIPGGGVDHGEDPVQALAREFAEETGLSIAVRRPVGVYFNLVEDPKREQLVHHDRVVFDVEITGGSLRPEPDGSSDAAGWFTPTEIAGLPLMSWTARLLDVPTEIGDEPADWPAAVAASRPVVPDGPITQVQRFAAYGLVRDPGGRILLTRIAAGYPGAGSWHLPGGGTDFGESAVQGLARELAEETGQRGDVGELLSITHFHNPAAYGPEKRPIDWHTVRTIFRVLVTVPTDPIVHEQSGSTDRAAWFTLAEARSLNLNRLARTVMTDYAL